MRVLIAGSSGYLGTALTAALRRRGDEVRTLVRRKPDAPREFAWDPQRGELDRAALEGVDAAVNLCGVGVADRRWSPEYKRLIRDSRVLPTRMLAEAVVAAEIPTLVNGSATGWYGDGGGVEVDETAPAAEDFLGRTCVAWEEATLPARQAGVRTALLRTGHVLGPGAVMLRRLRPLFALGLGGRFGDGRQPFPWIGLEDWIGAAMFVLDGELDGPVNLTGPVPATNADFARALARALRRPAPWRIPGFALRLGAGEAATEMLRGARVRPAALLDAGYEFRRADVDAALRAALDVA